MVNLYSIPTFITSFLVFSLGMIVCIRNKKEKANRVFFLMCLATSAWLFFASVAYNITSQTLAEGFMRLSYLGITFISITMFHFTVSFLNISSMKPFIVATYLYGFFCWPLFLKTNYLMSGTYKYFWGYYPRAGKFHPIFLVIFISLIVSCVILLLIQYLREKRSSSRKRQIGYLLLALFVYDFASIDFAPNYGIQLYPFGYVPTTLLIIIMAYSIIKHRLLNISLAITRFGIFVAVYSLVLGVPFGFAVLGKHWLANFMGKNWFWVPMVLLLILSTAGPSFYMYLQRRAENVLLGDERGRYNLLLEASKELWEVQDLTQLEELIVNLMAKNLQLATAAIYLKETELGQDFYVLKASLPSASYRGPEKIEVGNPLVRHLKASKKPIVYEELKPSSEPPPDAGEDRSALSLSREMTGLKASGVMPLIAKNDLLAFVALGEWKDKGTYSADLMDVLSGVGNQAAQAIKNIQSIIERDKALNEQLEWRRIKGLDTLTTSISHQVSNRLQAIIQLLAVAWEIWRRGAYKSFDLDQLLAYVDRTGRSIDKAIATAEEGGRVTEAIQNYAKGKLKFGMVNFDHALERSLELLLSKHGKLGVDIKREYPMEVWLWAAEAPLQDIIFNAMDNSCYSMKQKKEGSPDFSPRIIVRGQMNSQTFDFEIEDNGLGIKPENLRKVMDPMFTTKSHRDGTGMGTTVMLHFVRQHKGTIRYDSQQSEWTKVMISLPLATAEQIAAAKVADSAGAARADNAGRKGAA